MTYLVELRELHHQPTLARRASLPLDRIGPWLAETYAWIGTHLDQARVSIAGPPYARFTFAGDRADVEAGFPVAGTAPVHGDLVRSSLPGGTAAVTTHVGVYEGLQEAYEVVEAWITDHGGEPVGGHWEVYHDDPVQQPDSARWRTDVVQPYRLRTAGRVQQSTS